MASLVEDGEEYGGGVSLVVVVFASLVEDGEEYGGGVSLVVVVFASLVEVCGGGVYSGVVCGFEVEAELETP